MLDRPFVPADIAALSRNPERDVSIRSGKGFSFPQRGWVYVAAEAFGGDPMTQVTRIDLRTRLGTHLRQPVAARISGCVCRDLDYTDRYQTKWT